jgi:hypothetical protein
VCYLALLLERFMTPPREPHVPASSSWDLSKHKKYPWDCPEDADSHHTFMNALDGRVLGFVLDHVKIFR